eukprot:gnl/MRDRNA2_/MRDRNA2_101667_c0_seq1.p1 gnl/MRDRNA2_/MRDRNA2_101667_c0~~gnl/MRDRNA2_/MRDRNA2_101667_c0_seq1.p1  ORF type:complete len:640 (+),score=96.83 gnl/MRDRNA2_/MRDRNA2_101667_c0_seq1:53-1972(+)
MLSRSMPNIESAFAEPLLDEADLQRIHRRKIPAVLPLLVVVSCIVLLNHMPTGDVGGQHLRVNQDGMSMAFQSMQSVRKQVPQVRAWQSAQMSRAVSSTQAPRNWQAVPQARATPLGRAMQPARAWGEWSEPGSLSAFVTTSPGVQMPRLIYTIPWKQEPIEDLVISAVEAGFRGLDTAGQPAVGSALALLLASGITRESLYVQIKLDPKYAGELNPGIPITKQVELLILSLLSNLGLEYADCLVLDSPYPEHEQTMNAWSAMEDAVQKGLAKQLGVSRVVSLSQLRRIYADAKTKPAVVQQRFFAEASYERDVRSWCAETSVHFQAFGTLSANKRAIMSDNMQRLAAKFGVKPHVFFLRFVMGLGIVPVIGTTNTEHMKEDLSAGGVPLEPQDIEVIDSVLRPPGPRREDGSFVFPDVRPWYHSPFYMQEKLGELRYADFNHEHAGLSCHLAEDITEKNTPPGFQLRRHRVTVGSGELDFRRAREYMCRFVMIDRLPWANLILGNEEPVAETSSYSPGAMVATEVKCYNLVWSFNPCRIVCNDNDVQAHVAYGAGGETLRACQVAYSTVRGHLIAGEERFRVIYDETSGGDGRVVFEALSFTRGAGVLGDIVMFFVRPLQSAFFKDVGKAMQELMRPP